MNCQKRNVIRMKGTEIAEFYLMLLSENLNHARHVENERLMFNSVYMAMSGAFFAFATNLKSNRMTLSIVIVMFLMGGIAILLTRRWDNVFDCHIEYAKENYRILCQVLPEPVELEEKKDYLMKKSVEKPVYCFHPPNPKPKSGFEACFFRKTCIGKKLNKTRTRTFFLWFYILVELAHVVLFFYLL